MISEAAAHLSTRISQGSGVASGAGIERSCEGPLWVTLAAADGQVRSFASAIVTGKRSVADTSPSMRQCGALGTWLRQALTGRTAAIERSGECRESRSTRRPA